ncbi:hypothetical protein AOL_s00091g54 [Orbilia oligospora ATCC 24927]|uniref:Uncharacterized protein n=1 Tax=Arthrobotrys oligospora (strain ATCC 24927 / CBS 115.81 / DSM 1491) TaxID=756982 RepID=G1XI02_ARTOA|nr:hypothetical protein AOL_s00091g54 [Orbilia oligospora ATCC 24927]EGX47233.1 hypothetical protein AOL_s00091g54 [Orbilia oligospora ATCC 24927]
MPNFQPSKRQIWGLRRNLNQFWERVTRRFRQNLEFSCQAPVDSWEDWNELNPDSASPNPYDAIATAQADESTGKYLMCRRGNIVAETMGLPTQNFWEQVTVIKGPTDCVNFDHGLGRPRESVLLPESPYQTQASHVPHAVLRLQNNLPSVNGRDRPIGITGDLPTIEYAPGFPDDLQGLL